MRPGDRAATFFFNFRFFFVFKKILNLKVNKRIGYRFLNFFLLHINLHLLRNLDNLNSNKKKKQKKSLSAHIYHFKMMKILKNIFKYLSLFAHGLLSQCFSHCSLQLYLNYARDKVIVLVPLSREILFSSYLILLHSHQVQVYTTWPRD